ncbi:MAG: acylphosphatase [Spirochaetes bacterium]|nr:acylphosphatase [Spirochaetota bacterium]
MEKLMSLHVIVSGRVQGVGFRFFAQNTAKSMGLTGFVKNLYDGDVEIMAEGSQEVLSNFLERIKKGPSFSTVTDTRVTWEEISIKKYNQFGIKF